MIPTLFGVTLVSFVIMQLAPGDPMLAQIDSGGSAGQSTQTREAYLIQKRDLKLDKPIVLNFNDFRDYLPPITACAHFLSLTPQELTDELSALADKTPDALGRERLAFLESLPIKDFREKLAHPQQRPSLASAALAYARTYCEDTGAHGVGAAIAVLESNADRREKIGAIRALEYMVPDPFEYTFSRTPAADEAPQVEMTWRIWWNRNEKQFAPLDPDRRQVLDEQLAAMAAETSREKLFEQLENYDRDDTPFFVGVLLGDRPLKDKSIAAMFLLLYNGKPLEVDVPLDADSEQVDRVSENWQAHYEANHATYQVSLPNKLWNVVADTQYAHMVWRLATFNFGRSALKTREPVSEKLWNAVAVSAPLMIMAEIFIYMFAVPLGVVCAVNRGKFLDRLISLELFLLYSIPAFVAGMLFLLFLCYGGYLKLFPMERLHSEGAETLGPAAFLLDYLWHAVLPVTCLALFSLAGLAMYSRSSMLDVINQDYVRTARAKGLSQRKVILKHVLRNGMIPIITLFSGFLPAMLGGSVLVEYLFNIPGMGRLSFSSIEQKDFPTLMALIYIDAIVVMLSILMTDVLYVLVDRASASRARGRPNDGARNLSGHRLGAVQEEPSCLLGAGDAGAVVLAGDIRAGHRLESAFRVRRWSRSHLPLVFGTVQPAGDRRLRVQHGSGWVPSLARTVRSDRSRGPSARPFRTPAHRPDDRAVPAAAHPALHPVFISRPAAGKRPLLAQFQRAGVPFSRHLSRALPAHSIRLDGDRSERRL